MTEIEFFQNLKNLIKEFEELLESINDFRNCAKSKLFEKENKVEGFKTLVERYNILLNRAKPIVRVFTLAKTSDVNYEMLKFKIHETHRQLKVMNSNYLVFENLDKINFNKLYKQQSIDKKTINLL